MNFLLNAFEGNAEGDNDFGDDGGWGSEDDIDLSDGEYDTETTGYDTEVTPQQPSAVQGQPVPPPPPPPPQTYSSPSMMGGGMLMGRLTQFLDVVSPQAENEGFSDEDGYADDDVNLDASGWADDDAEDAMSLLDDGDDAADEAEHARNEISIFSDQAVVTPAAIPPPPPPPGPPAGPDVSCGDESQFTSAAVGMASTTNMNTTFDAENEDEINEDDGTGWDEDDCLELDDVDNDDVLNVDDAIEADITFEQQSAQTKSVEPAPPSPPPQPVNDIGSDNGRDDDDGLLLLGNTEEPQPQPLSHAVQSWKTTKKEIDSSKKIDSCPPPPPPPPPATLPISDDKNETSEECGWDDDDCISFSNKDGEDQFGVTTFVGEHACVENATNSSQQADPPPAPTLPPAATFENNESNDEESELDDDAIPFGDRDSEAKEGMNVVKVDMVLEKASVSLQQHDSATSIPPAPPPPPASPSPETATKNTDNENGSGWDDDGLSFGDEDGKEMVEGNDLPEVEKAVEMEKCASEPVDFNLSCSPALLPKSMVSPTKMIDNNNRDGRGWDDDSLSFDDKEGEEGSDVLRAKKPVENAICSSKDIDLNQTSPPPPLVDSPNMIEDESNKEGSGWDDDDDLSFDDKDGEEGSAVSGAEKVFGENPSQEVDLDQTSPPPPPPPALVVPHSRITDESNKEGSGWDDDDLSFDDKDGKEGSGVSGAEKAVVDRVMGSSQEFDLNKTPPPSPPPPPPPTLVVSPSRIADENNKEGSGWDDDALSFDDKDREGGSDAFGAEKAVIENLSQEVNLNQTRPPSPPPAALVVSPSRMIDESNKDGSGWDDDDDDLSFDDKDGDKGSGVFGAEKAVVERAIGSSQEVDLNQTPPPPPSPPSPALVVSPSRMIDENNEEGSGWDDDALSFDDNGRENVVDAEKAVKNAITSSRDLKFSQPTPSPPPPPPPKVASHTNTIDNTTEEGSGWDDDISLFDDNNRKDDAMEKKKDEVRPDASIPPPPPPLSNPHVRSPNTNPCLSFDGESLSTTAAVGMASNADSTNEFDAGNVNDTVDGAGWDDDDGLLDDVAESDLSAKKEAEPSKLVDAPAPPPPPPVESTVSSKHGLDDDAFALDHDDGWGDDDDFGMNISDDFDADMTVDENKNVVDHIPSPSTPSKQEDPTLKDVAHGDDDISQDDTLSIANSRSQQNAVSAGIRTTSTSTFDDEDTEPAAEASVSETETEVETTDATIRSVSTFSSGSGRLSRKVVDYTPRRMRISGNDSLMVSGHCSVGESLDSIDEANEEDYEDELDIDNAENLRRLSGAIVPEISTSQEHTSITPRTMESGWGALRQLSQVTPPKKENLSSEIPFGAAITPTAANINNQLNRFEALKNERGDSNRSPNGVEPPLVDHTPGITDGSNTDSQSDSQVLKPSMANSIDVFADSSEGDLGETDTVGVDDIKDELYGPMVDHLPATPRDDSPTRRLRKTFSGQISVGSTVVGQAENKDIQKDIREDDAMDDEEEGGEDTVDESSRGRGSTLEFDNRSLLSGLPLPVVDETQYLVDHVPVDKLLRGGGAASLMVAMDTSTASSRVEDNVDGSNHANFGPIVDHTPSLAGPSRGAPSIATSVATAVSGLDGDIKEDDDMDNTTIAGGTVGSVANGDEEELDKVEEDLGKVEDDPIVDHVPDAKTLPVNADVSIRVLVGKEDDMTQVDTIAEDVVLEFGPIVDQTPLPSSRPSYGGISVGASLRAQRHGADDNNTATIASVSQVDENSGWDHDEPDLDDISAVGQSDEVLPLTSMTKQENNVVDRIPRRSFTKPVNGSTIVMVDPVDATSEVDDADDDTAGNARVDKFGPVVDHTPAPRSTPLSLATSMANRVDGGNGSDNRPEADIDGSATWFGASTLGGISSAVGDDDSGTGWDEDDLGDLASPVNPRPLPTPLNDHLVDHIPSLASPRNVDTNASTTVAIDPSIVSNQTQDDKIGGGIFGAVVDHTPSVDPISRRSVDNSTMATGFATNTKQDGEMDETTWQGGVSAQGEGWDQDDPELEALVNDDEDAPSHLVDHVPERPESRYGDPSLVVAANPSDMSSQVEDLNQDENHFGPVVDQTPLERVLSPPAVGSTVVALPSVLNDVSDDGDNDESNADGDRIPNEWEEQIPNPQSGIDVDNTREQLVDAVPQPPPPEHQSIARDASSEMATVDDKSTQVPADEPKEDEFGPVVDHTPTGEPTNIKGVGNQDSCPRVNDGEKKPAANLDSVAPICSVESKEKQDGLDEDGFGPVVDQLPASCSKASLAPSKGGSTVDALATVSEGEDDLNTRDGWDDDTLDLVDHTSPANMSHRANHSVTWDDNVFNSKEEVDPKVTLISKQSNDVADSTFFTAVDTNESSDLNQTKYFDCEENGWGNDSFNIADDDTPPSTPRLNATFRKKAVVDGLASETLIGVLKTPEERNDLKKLLQQEMAKSLLLEKESEALRKMVDSLKEAKELLLTAAKQHAGREDQMMDAISKWQEANGGLSDDLTKSRDENEKLSDDNIIFRNEIGKLSSMNEKLSEGNTNYQDEIGKLSSENAKLVEDISEFRDKNCDLSSKNETLSSQNRKLSEDILNIEGKCVDLRGQNEVQSSEIQSLRTSISQLEDEKLEIFGRETAQKVEIANLKNSIEKQLEKSISDASLRQEITSAQMELSAKVNECSQLSSQLILVEEKLRKSEGQNFKNTKDLAKITKEKLEEILELKKEIESQQQDLEMTRLVNLESIADLKKKLSSGAASNKNLEQENKSLLQEKNDLKSLLETTKLESQQDLSRKDATIQSLGSKLKSAQDSNACLTDQVNVYAEQVERLKSLSMEIESITRERDVLKEEILNTKTHVESLQKHFQDLNSLLGFNNPDPATVVKTIQTDRAKQLREIESSHRQICDLTNKIGNIECEKNSIQAQLDEYRKSHEVSQKESAAAAQNAIREDAKLKKIQGEVHQLRTKLQCVSDELLNSEKERSLLTKKRTLLEDEVRRLGESSAQNENLNHNLMKFQGVNESQRKQINALESKLSDNDRLLSSKDREIIMLQEQQILNNSDVQAMKKEKEELLVDLEKVHNRVNQLSSERDSFAQNTENNSATINNLNEQVTNLNGQLDDLNEELHVLVHQRDILLDEKDKMEIEAEEMLVQFGLVNEDLVGKDAEIMQMEETLARLEEEREIHAEEVQEMKDEANTYLKKLEDERQQHRKQLEGERQTYEQELRVKDQNLQVKEFKEKELGNDLQLAHQKYQECEDQLHMSEEKLNSLIRESEEMMKNVGNVDANTKKLMVINSALRDKLRAMTSEQTAAAEQMQAMESHKLGLNGRVDVLQNLVDELITSFEAKEGKLQSTIDGVKIDKEEIVNKSLSQEKEIARLSQELEASKGFAEECLLLRREIMDFENKLSEKDRLLLQKDAAAQDLYNQLQVVGNTPVESAEMEMLRETVKKLEETVANDRKRLQEVGENYDQTQQDLLRTKEQHQVSNETARQLAIELDSKQSVESTNHMLESRLDQLEQELMTSRTEETKYCNEVADLKEQLLDQKSLTSSSTDASDTIAALRQQIEDLEQEKKSSSKRASAREERMHQELHDLQDQLARTVEEASSAASGREEGMKQELREVQDQMTKAAEALEKEKEAAFLAATAREEKLDQELNLLRDHLAQKDEQISTMEDKLQSLDKDLCESKLQTSERQENINELTTEVDVLKSFTSQSSHMKILEENQMMQDQLVAIAKAFETSEICRAEVLEKIETERQAHAESIRRMTVNMKRFYATLSMGDMS